MQRSAPSFAARMTAHSLPICSHSRSASQAAGHPPGAHPRHGALSWRHLRSRPSAPSASTQRTQRFEIPFWRAAQPGRFPQPRLSHCFFPSLYKVPCSHSSSHCCTCPSLLTPGRPAWRLTSRRHATATRAAGGPNCPRTRPRARRLSPFCSLPSLVSAPPLRPHARAGAAEAAPPAPLPSHSRFSSPAPSAHCSPSPKQHQTTSAATA